MVDLNKEHQVANINEFMCAQILHLLPGSYITPDQQKQHF